MQAHDKGNHLGFGAQHFIAGLKLLFHPKLRKFILVPLLVNCVIFAVLTAVTVGYIDELAQLDWHFPEVLKFLETTLKSLMWFFILAILIIAYGYIFNIITNFLAAPFYGYLAQKTEELVTGQSVPDEGLVSLVLRTLWRELGKLVYFITRGVFIFLLMLLLGTIPLLNVTVPLVGGLWGAWCMALQYADYSADNHQTEFARLRKKLRYRRYSSIGFGSIIMLFSMIPFVNIIVIPAAVVGGTLFWLEELKELP